jgi:hypothetical protein
MQVVDRYCTMRHSFRQSSHGGLQPHIFLSCRSRQKGEGARLTKRGGRIKNISLAMVRITGVEKEPLQKKVMVDVPLVWYGTTSVIRFGG